MSVVTTLEKLKKKLDLRTLFCKITCDKQVKLPAFLRQNYLHHRHASCNPQVSYMGTTTTCHKRQLGISDNWPLNPKGDNLPQIEKGDNLPQNFKGDN